MLLFVLMQCIYLTCLLYHYFVIFLDKNKLVFVLLHYGKSIFQDYKWHTVSWSHKRTLLVRNHLPLDLTLKFSITLNWTSLSIYFSKSDVMMVCVYKSLFLKPWLCFSTLTRSQWRPALQVLHMWQVILDPTQHAKAWENTQWWKAMGVYTMS